MSHPPTLTWPALLAALRETPDRLRELASGAGPDAPCRSLGEGEWSACEIAAHLCAVESPYRARLVRIALQDNPHVAAIGPITGDYDPATPIDILLDTLARLRADTAEFLEGLPVDARARPAVHAELGPITLRSQAEALLAHDEVHLAQMAAALRAQPQG